MKIYNIYMQKPSNSLYSKTTFKGEFDKYAFISQKIVNARIANQRTRHESNVSSYNSQISHADNRLSSLKGQIKSLKKEINENDFTLEALRTEGSDIVTEVHNKKNLVKDLSESNPKLIQQYHELKNDIENEANAKVVDEIKIITDETKRQCNSMETGFKNQCIKKVIKPILHYEDNIPSSIYIENLSGIDNINEEISSWICGTTNARSEKIDLIPSQKPIDFINKLKKLLLTAYRNFEGNGNWTMIFINHINSLNVQELDNIHLNLLKEIFASCSESYHSSIVAISSNPIEHLIPKLKFTEHIKLDKSFIQDNNVGLRSLAKDLIGKKL